MVLTKLFKNKELFHKLQKIKYVEQSRTLNYKSRHSLRTWSKCILKSLARHPCRNLLLITSIRITHTFLNLICSLVYIFLITRNGCKTFTHNILQYIFIKWFTRLFYCIKVFYLLSISSAASLRENTLFKHKLTFPYVLIE